MAALAVMAALAAAADADAALLAHWPLTCREAGFLRPRGWGPLLYALSRAYVSCTLAAVWPLVACTEPCGILQFTPAPRSRSWGLPVAGSRGVAAPLVDCLTIFLLMGTSFIYLFFTTVEDVH